MTLTNWTRNPLHEWYRPAANRSGAAKLNSSDTEPTPMKKVTWAESSKASANTSSKNKEDFQLGMDLSYCSGTGKNMIAVYEGDSTNGLMHMMRLEDVVRLDTHNSTL